MEVLDVLLKLQEVDLELGRIKAEQDAIPAKLEELDIKTNEYREEVARLEEELKVQKLNIREAESKTQDLDEKEKKYKGQLNTVKTNREYSALLTEIEAVKREKQEIDDEVLKSMEKSESIEAKIDESKKTLDAYLEETKDSRDELTAKKKEFDEEIAVEQQKRDNLVVRIDKTILSFYEKIASSRPGTAVVPVAFESCRGCHGMIPLQMINEVRKGDQIITCPNCGRILFYEEEETAQKA